MADTDARDLGRLLLCGGGIAVLVLMTSYLVRTSPPVRSTIRERFQSLARTHDATLRVQSLHPEGLTGMELRDVELRGRRAGIRVQLEADALEVHPSWWALLRGEVAPGRVVVQGGSSALTHLGSEASSSSSTNVGTFSPPEAPPGADSESAPAPPVRISLHDHEVRVAMPRRGFRTRPISLARLAFTFDRRSPLDELAPRGYGEWPDGTSFSIATQWSEAFEAYAITVEPTGRLDGETLVETARAAPNRWQRWLRGMSLKGVTACPGCRERRLCLQSLHLSPPNDYELQTSRVCAQIAWDTVALELDEARALRDGDVLPHRLKQLTFSARRSGVRADLQAELESSNRGEASIRARWRARNRLDVELEARQLHLDDLWPFLGLQSHLQRGVLNGDLQLAYEHDLELASLDTNVTYHDAQFQHDFIGDEPLAVGPAHLQTDALVDVGARALSLSEMTLTLADAAPVELSGFIVDAEPGWSFEARVGTRDVRAPRLLDVLPHSLTRPALGARLEGQFDASLTARGHTAFPESLQMDVDVQGDVDVLRDSPRSNVFGLALAGPPPPGVPTRPFDIPLRQWVELDRLPDHVPRAIIGAEDSRFYKHPGFNWRGLRNAMAHNLEVDRLERGGSTITQQLAKNLFLTRERTLARKIKEVWVTWRLESALSKDRILELYLNIAEWAPDGRRGLREASYFYFDRPPEELEVAQTTLLAAILPGPALFGSLIDRGYIASSRIEKIEHVLSNLQFWEVVTPEEYREIYEAAKRGEIGGLELTICEDDGHAPDGDHHAPPDAPKCSELSDDEG